MKGNADRELQETIAEMESGRKQLEALVQQSMMFEKAILELNGTIELLSQLKKKKPGAEIMVPIGGDSYITASLMDTETVLAGVGAGVSVEKKVDDAITSVKDRADQLGKALIKLRENAVGINDRVEELSRAVQGMMQQPAAKK